MCLVSVWCGCWLILVALCSGRSSDWKVEVLEAGGGEDLEEREDEDVEEGILVIRGWERWLRECRCDSCPAAGPCMISAIPSHCDNGELIVVLVRAGYLNAVRAVMSQRPGWVDTRTDELNKLCRRAPFRVVSKWNCCRDISSARSFPRFFRHGDSLLL